MGGGGGCISESMDAISEEGHSVFEFNGCFWHGCPKCYNSDTIHPVYNVPMHELYTRTNEKKAFVQNHTGLAYVEIWECEWDHMYKDFPEDTRKSLEDGIMNPNRSALNPRDAFFGGRTNAAWLFYKVSGDEKIQYVDFCSLDPYTSKYCSYPVGHPQVVTDNFKDISQYYGIIKCSVLAPSTLYHPVLPYRAVGKLMFPLCRTCAETEQKVPCRHSDEDGTLSRTYVRLPRAAKSYTVRLCCYTH